MEKRVDKQEVLRYLIANKFVVLPEKFTGQVTLIMNINHGGVTDIDKTVRERIK